MAMTLRLPPEIEAQLKQVAEVEHRSVQQTVLVAIEEYLSMRETAEILADPSALRGPAEARESEQSGDVVYGAEAARALLAERGQAAAATSRDLPSAGNVRTVCFSPN